MWSACEAGSFVLCVSVCCYCVGVSGGILMWCVFTAGGFVCLYIGIVWLWVEGIKCGVSAQQVAVWCVCVCVCVGIVWLWVEGIKCGVSVQQVTLYWLCVCVLVFCGCEWRELDVEWVCSRWLCIGCVCVGIVWLWVEGIKCGVRVQQVTLCWLCVLVLCGCE